MNQKGCIDVDTFQGACQCGAVKYSVAPGPARQTVCHCRMCQRATGNAFAPLMEVDNDRITWTGYAKTFRSSNIAERGFCDECGTPLFYRMIDRDTTEFMAGTIDTDIVFHPVENYGAESRLSWVFGLAAVAEQETVIPADQPIVSHQFDHGS